MKSIATLIRVKQREIDVLKRQQVAIETQRADIVARIDRLAQQLQKELASAEHMPEMAQFFGDFSANIKKRQELLRVQQQKLDVELDRIAAQIFDRFTEMKKYEIALAQWKKQRAAKEAQRTQQEMDEVALRGYIRRDVP